MKEIEKSLDEITAELMQGHGGEKDIVSSERKNPLYIASLEEDKKDKKQVAEVDQVSEASEKVYKVNRVTVGTDDMDKNNEPWDLVILDGKSFASFSDNKKVNNSIMPSKSMSNLEQVTTKVISENQFQEVRKLGLTMAGIIGACILIGALLIIAFGTPGV